jgi:hypothetical protein
MPQRDQSFHSIGARGSGAGAFVGVGEEVEREDSSGQNTALTRRGLIVALLSCDFARKEHERQWPIRAAYKTRKELSRSGRRSWGYSGRSAGQRSVPSGCGVKADPGKPPVKEGRAH